MLSLELLAPELSICKVSSLEGLQADFFFAACTDREMSLVCPSGQVPGNVLARDDGWRAIRVCGTLDLSLTGVLAPMASLLAAHAIGIFALSTYDTDYLLVRSGQCTRAVQLLSEAGYPFPGPAESGLRP